MGPYFAQADSTEIRDIFINNGVNVTFITKLLKHYFARHLTFVSSLKVNCFEAANQTFASKKSQR